MKLKTLIFKSNRPAAGRKHSYFIARIIGIVAVLAACVLAVSGVVGYSYSTRSARFAQAHAAKLAAEANRHASVLSGYISAYDHAEQRQKDFAAFVKEFDAANKKFLLTEAFLTFKKEKDASDDEIINLFIKDAANKSLIGDVFSKFAKNANQTTEVVSYLKEAAGYANAETVYASLFKGYIGSAGSVGEFLSAFTAPENEHDAVYAEAASFKKQLDSELSALKTEYKAEISHRTNVLSHVNKYASADTEAKALEFSEKLSKEAESYLTALSKSDAAAISEREAEIKLHIETLASHKNAYLEKIDDSYKNTLGESYDLARSHQKRIETHAESFNKTAPNAVKKADIAVTDVAKAIAAADEAYANAAKLYEDYLAGSVGDKLIDSLLSSSITLEEASSVLSEYLGSPEAAEEAVVKAVETVTESGKTVSEAAYSLVHELAAAELSDALKAVNSTETKLISAIDGVAAVYKNSDLEWEYEAVKKTTVKTPADIKDIVSAIEELSARARSLETLTHDITLKANESLSAAEGVMRSDSTAFNEKLLLEIGNKSIFITLTGALVLIAGLIALLIPGKFAHAWKNIPTFSTFIIALLMVIILTYAHGNTVDFHFASFSEWSSKWVSLILDVLRSNAFIGMVALGMTFVIITGGIDLAVGSTLAGIATVVMVILDVSQNGVFTAAGLTGVPNYIVAIAAGIVTGIGLGAITGIIITKGRVPPFIVTLGVMNIVRSVAQYFTKSIKISVPKEFQAISNAPIGEYILLPIIYWLILAVIMYIISKHTAFGRHIYAVGSNERTSRLSGINVDRVKISVYMLMGFIVAIAAVTQVGRLGAVDVASAGNGLEMSAIAAVVVGGTSMAGGRGSILGTILGVLIIGIMDKLVILLHIDAFLSNAFVGAIIIFAVLMQRKDK